MLSIKLVHLELSNWSYLLCVCTLMGVGTLLL